MLALATTSTDLIISMLPFIVPLVLIELGLKVYSLVDVSKAERQVRGNKLVWVLIILLISTFGPLAYLFFGRKDL